MIIQHKFEGLTYWLGAIVVVSSFVFVDSEGVKEEPVASIAVFDRESENGDEDNESSLAGGRDDVREERESDRLLG